MALCKCIRRKAFLLSRSTPFRLSHPSLKTFLYTKYKLHLTIDFRFYWGCIIKRSYKLWSVRRFVGCLRLTFRGCNPDYHLPGLTRV